MKYEGYEAKWEMKFIQNFYQKKIAEKGPIRKLKRWLEDNIKIDLN
jgi:hypothetical protein